MTENVPEEYTFWLENGRHVRNLHELVKELHHMDDATFNHHVTNDRNDFANWVLHIIKNEQLAKLLNGCKDKKTMEKLVAEEIHEEREVKLVVKGSSELPSTPQPAVKEKAPLRAKPKTITKPKQKVTPKSAQIKPKTTVKSKPAKKTTLTKPKQTVKKANRAKPKNIVKKGPVTPLTVSTPRRVVKRGKTTRLHVGERHTRRRQDENTLLSVGSYIALGVMMGVGIAIVSIALL